MRLLPILSVLLLASPAVAHVTIAPRQSALGAYERYTIRAPNERQSATVRIEAEFPPEARVISFSDTPGWTLTVRRDTAGRITGAVWDGRLAPERFAEFGIIAINPRDGTTLRWSFVQTYADGTIVRWAGAPGSPTPASMVTLHPADAPAAHH